MFQRLKNLMSRPALGAAVDLPPPAPIKAKPGVASFPSYLTSTKVTDAPLAIPDRRLATTDTMTYRNSSDTRAVIRDLVASSPDLSAAVWANARLGIPKKYSVIGKNLDGTFNRDATALAHQFIQRFDILPDFTADGFSGSSSVRSISESLAVNIVTTGAMCGEIVLDKARMPKRVQPIESTQIRFIAAKDKSLIPQQWVGELKITLDSPTFLWVSLDQSLLNAYATSPLEAAIKPALFIEDFANDIHRIIKKVIHPRNTVKINEEMVRKSLSLEAQSDPIKANEELNAIKSSIENTINGMRPEDALVYLDSIEFVVQDSSNSGLAAEYGVLQSIANGRVAAGSKTMGTVLGHDKASSNIASAEVMLFQKSVTGAVTLKLNEFWSRALTLSVRLMGVDAVVTFEFADIDLRPEADLMAFRQTEQMMILERLSLGLITDEEASIALTGKLPPMGMKPLSGTGFRTGAGLEATQAAAQTQEKTNNGSTLNQNLNGDTPDKGRGQNKKADGNVVMLG